jgi:hypothetical protein
MQSMNFEFPMRMAGLGVSVDTALGLLRDELRAAGEDPSDGELVAFLNDDGSRDRWIERLRLSQPNLFATVHRSRNMTDRDFQLETYKAATLLADARDVTEQQVRMLLDGGLGRTRREFGAQ